MKNAMFSYNFAEYSILFIAWLFLCFDSSCFSLTNTDLKLCLMLAAAIVPTIEPLEISNLLWNGSR